MSRTLFALCLLTLCSRVAVADGPDLGPHRLTLTPAKATDPALKYRLLPELIEQRPGNAAEHYRKATTLYKAIAEGPSLNQAYDWVGLPVDLLPKDEVAALLKAYREPMAEAEIGARCETCEWGTSDDLRKKNIGALLPYVQEMRALSVLFQVRLRLELAEGRPGQAVRTARTALAMARHVAESPTLISALVGYALTAQTLRQMEDLVQQPEAPNLYWALTDLPRPFIDLRKGLEGERLTAYSIFYPDHPEFLFDLNAGPLPPEQARELGNRFVGVANLLDVPRFAGRWVFGLNVMRKHEEAKKALVAAGRPRDKVEAMPPLQVALLHALTEYDLEMDAMLKWQSEPWWETRPKLLELERQTRRLRPAENIFRRDGPALPLAGYLLPALNKIAFARVRTDRQIALLRCVEAVRLHAATHDGKLPASLAEIKDVPLPLDPATGKAFQYEIKGATATLRATVVEGRNDFSHAPSYEIMLRKS
jgi:hypothetical protein